MTQRLNISLKALVAMLLLSGSLLPCTPAARAEIRLHAATGMQFSLAFRPATAAATRPVLSVQPPDVEELSASSLYTVQINLLHQQTILSQLSPLSPQPGRLPGLIGAQVADHITHNTQALPLGSAAWNFPKACVELVSGQRPAPQLLASRSLVLNADYAATAFEGTCTAWDLTSSLGRSHSKSGALKEDHMTPVHIAIAIPTPSTIAYRDSPMQAVATQLLRTDQFTASAMDAQPPQPDLPEPTRGGDSVRPWVLKPRMAATFRGSGFQLISNNNQALPQPATPAVRPPSVRQDDTGSTTP